jgi:drug/metabolite transporter (DMT)-like permease
MLETKLRPTIQIGPALMRIFLLTALTMIAFAANSILGRTALEDGAIDASSYSLIRLGSGAVMLAILVGVSKGFSRKTLSGGNLFSALSLFVYAAAFSFSYINIETGVGALILFACVQATMIGWSLFKGDRPSGLEWLGMIIAFGAFVWLVSPGLQAPDPIAALLIAFSGIAWGIYSLRGKSASDPLMATAGNFILSVPMALALLLVMHSSLDITQYGVLLAIASGAITSGLGYALWYRVLKQITPTKAAIVQLTVPVLAGFGGTLVLNEAWTFRFALASALILGGVAISILAKNKRS